MLLTESDNNGEVNGMTFVGEFKGTASNIRQGIYDIDTYTDGLSLTQSQAEVLKATFVRNSYVQGKHYTNHNIQVDGFYTNYINTEYDANDNIISQEISTEYIEPTPRNADYYRWIAGEPSEDLVFDEDMELIATKYDSTATKVVTLNGLNHPNTIVRVVDFDTSDLKPGVQFFNPNSIPNIAATAQDANTKYGLVMTAGNTGWSTRGSTYFLDNALTLDKFTGTDEYISDNSNTTPSFSFYLAHSKNISSTEDLGTVTVKLQATYLENSVIKNRYVYIVFQLSTNNTLTQDINYYEGSITPGKEYSMFPTTTTTITEKSSFSAYYSVYLTNYSQLTDTINGVQRPRYYVPFAGNYYHVISSSCKLPQGTKITLIDKSFNTTKYYYYITTGLETATGGRYRYRFSDFKAMNSTNEPYSSDGAYYNSTTDTLFEQFIIHLDFEDVTLSQDLVDQNLLVQLIDAYDHTSRLSVNTALYPMLFSIYNSISVNAGVILTTSAVEQGRPNNVLYIGSDLGMEVETQYILQRNAQDNNVYDTTHIDDQLGIKLTILSGSRQLTSSELTGIYINYNNINYYTRQDGSFRIKLADAVSNVLANMTLCSNTINSLPTGTYTIRVEAFGSNDGINFSTPIAYTTQNIQIINTSYGFEVGLNDNSVIIDKTTGRTKNNNNSLNFNVQYSGSFTGPRITVKLLRRRYNQVYSYDYETVDLADYVTTQLTTFNATTKEYLVTNNVLAQQNFLLNLDQNLTTGTYKVSFILYDGNNEIATIDKTIIIK